MIVRFFAESLEEMEYTPEQIETVKEEIKKNYQQFLGWVDDGGEEFAYDRLRRVIEDIYGVGAMVERVKGEEPVFGEPLSRKIFDFLGGLSSESTRGGGNLEILCGHPAADRDHPPSVHRTER